MTDPGIPTDADPERAAAQLEAEQAAKPTVRYLLIVLAGLVAVSALVTGLAVLMALAGGGTW